MGGLANQGGNLCRRTALIRRGEGFKPAVHGWGARARPMRKESLRRFGCRRRERSVSAAVSAAGRGRLVARKYASDVWCKGGTWLDHLMDLRELGANHVLQTRFFRSGAVAHLKRGQSFQ